MKTGIGLSPEEAKKIQRRAKFYGKKFNDRMVKSHE